MGTHLPISYKWSGIISMLIITVLLFSCKQKKHVASIDHDIYYTCSMHPQIMVNKPGNCPICGMKLIQATKSATKNSNELKLSDQQILLGNIKVDTIHNESIGDNAALTATLSFDQKNVTSISARVEGRIDKLYFQTTGNYVNKGDKLFDIYSEALNNAKQEYISALERQKVLGNAVVDFNSLIKSAKNKLLLWGMSETQVDQLAKSMKSTPLTTFYSNTSGYIIEEGVKEGDYIMEGAAILRLANLSTLWAEAQVYSSNLSEIDPNSSASIKVPDIPGKEWKGSIEFVNPEINPDTRINLIRISINNLDNRLKPGMPAYVFIKSHQRSSLSLPVDAVLRGAEAAIVWVQTKANTFESRMIKTGLETEGHIEITEGLHIGDIVVISGAYLINSEYIFQRGTVPMAEMEMDKK